MQIQHSHPTPFKNVSQIPFHTVDQRKIQNSEENLFILFILDPTVFVPSAFLPSNVFPRKFKDCKEEKY